MKEHFYELDRMFDMELKNYMPNSPMNGIGFMGMVDNMNNENQSDRAIVTKKPIVNDGSKWICPLCGATNTGRFCCECGGVRPQQ